MSIDYLNHAIIELTPVCNLRCRHCYNYWKSDSKQHLAPPASYQKAFRLLDHLLRHTSVKDIVFTGGEPTLAERFIELVLHAKLKNRTVTIITNGNGPESVYRQLAALRIDQCEISIHASKPEIHDRITGVEGSWQRAISTLQMMLANRIEVTPVIVITAINQADITETVRFFYEMGIRHIMVNRYNMGGEGLRDKHLSASHEQLRQVFCEINDFASNHPIRIFSGVCTPHCLLDPADYPLIGFGSCSSNVYNRPLTFDTEGNIRMCNHSPVVAGNIYRQSFEEIFISDYVQEWDCLEAIEYCQDCSLLSVCKGGCRAASEQTNGSLNKVDPVVRTFNK